MKRASAKPRGGAGRACDLDRVEFGRTHWPFLRDRRIDAYGDLTRRFVDRPPGADRRGDRRSAADAVRAPRVLAGTPGRARLHVPGRVAAARRPPGSAGRGPKASRFPGFYHERIEDVIGVIGAIAALRARAPQRARTPTTNGSSREMLEARRRAAAARPPSPHPHQRVLDPRSRPGLRAAHARAAASQAAVVDWGFNAWGGKYPPWDADDAVPTRVGARAGAAGVRARHRDGGRRRRLQRRRHACSPPRRACCNTNRNPRLPAGRDRALPARTTTASSTSSGSARASPATTPTATSTTWRGSWRADDRHGVEDDPRRRQLPRAARQSRGALDRARDPDGRPFTIVELPMPRPVVYEGQRLPATYVNFLLRQRRAAGADLRRPRAATARRWPACSARCRGAGWSASTAGRSSGASARSTA